MAISDLAKAKNFNIPILGFYQVSTLGSLNLVANNSQLDLSVITLLYGISIFFYYLFTRNGYKFLGKLKLNTTHLLSCLGMVFASFFLILAINDFSYLKNSENELKLTFFLLSRVFFVIFGGLILPLSMFQAFKAKGISTGHILTSRFLNLGRIFGLIFTLLLGQINSLILLSILGIIYASSLIFNSHPCKEFFLEKTRFNNSLIKGTIFWPIIVSSLSSFTFIHVIQVSEVISSQENHAHILITKSLLISALTIFFTKTCLKKIKHRSEHRSLILVAVVGLILSLTQFFFINNHYKLFLFVITFSVSTSLIPHFYFKNAFIKSPDKDFLKISAHINSNHIAGNALGVLLASLSIWEN